MRHQLLAGIGCAPYFLPGGLIESNDEGIPTRCQKDAVPVDQRILSRIPSGDCSLVILDQVLLPDYFAGFCIQCVKPAFGIKGKNELLTYGRNRTGNAMVRAHFDRIAPLPDVFSICQRNAADQMLFLFVVIVVQIDSAVLDSSTGIPFTDRRLPEDFGSL